jgi:hypothetical protein
MMTEFSDGWRSKSGRSRCVVSVTVCSCVGIYDQRMDWMGSLVWPGLVWMGGMDMTDWTDRFFCLLDVILSVFVCVVGFTPKDFLYTYMQGAFEGLFVF